MANVSITSVSEKQKKKRIIIQNKVLELMDKLELSDKDLKDGKKSYNRQVWEERFRTMSDLDFHKMMVQMKEKKGFCFSFEADSVATKNKSNMTVNKLDKIAKEYGYKLREYVMFPHKNRANPDNPMISRSPLPILVLTVKRLQQMLTKKNKITADNSVTNYITGQVTNDSKAARLSNTQTYSLITSNQVNSIKEFLSIRADDETAKRELYRDIEQTGTAKLSNYDLKSENKQSIQAMEVFLRASGLYTNILRSSGFVKVNKKSVESMTENIDNLNKNDLYSYKMIIFGEMHKDSDSIKRINKIISEYKPNYLLHEMVNPGDIISPKEAKRKLTEKDTVNKLGVDITDLYRLAIYNKLTLVGIDEDYDLVNKTNNVKKQFILREHKMLEHINQFYALDNIKIAVVVGDTHLRFLPTKELGEKSPIVSQYVNDDMVLIVRAKNREIDLKHQLKFIFSKIHEKNKVLTQHVAAYLDEMNRAEVIGKIEYVKVHGMEEYGYFVDIVINREFRDFIDDYTILTNYLKSNIKNPLNTPLFILTTDEIAKNNSFKVLDINSINSLDDTIKIKLKDKVVARIL